MDERQRTQTKPREVPAGYKDIHCEDTVVLKQVVQEDQGISTFGGAGEVLNSLTFTQCWRCLMQEPSKISSSLNDSVIWQSQSEYSGLSKNDSAYSKWEMDGQKQADSKYIAAMHCTLIVLCLFQFLFILNEWLIKSLIKSVTIFFKWEVWGVEMRRFFVVGA